MSNNQSSHLKFLESDNALTRAIIGTYIDIYNLYYQVTRGNDMDRMLAEIVLRTLALAEIGEVDETVCEAVESACRELSEDLTKVGRSVATIIQHMNNRRNGGEGMDAVAEQWPDVVNENEM